MPVVSVHAKLNPSPQERFSRDGDRQCRHRDGDCARQADSRRLPSDPIQPENRRAMALDSLRELLPVVTPLLGAALACAADKSDDTNPTLQRERMVAQQIEARGVKDARTLAAMRKVPRHLFVPAASAIDAYEDHPLPIGQGQTISQPYIVAFMTEALGLQGGETVLEVGTGSGYQAAVLSEIAAKVYT